MEQGGDTSDNPIDRYIAEVRKERPDYSKSAFAKQCECSRGAIYRIINGDDAVSTDLFEQIHTATDGLIDAVDLFRFWRGVRVRKQAAARDPAAA